MRLATELVVFYCWESRNSQLKRLSKLAKLAYNSHKWTLQGQVLLMLLHIKRICASKLLDQKFGKIVEEKRMKSKCNYVLYFVSNYTKRFLIISSIFTSSYRYVGGKGIPLESSTK